MLKRNLRRVKKHLTLKRVLAILAILVALLVKLNRTNNFNLSSLPKPPLKALAAEKGIDLGNFAIKNRINEKAYKQILVSQFNLALIDNTPNWYFTDGGLRPGQHDYNFGDMDFLVQFAKQNDLKIEAHHFLWGEEKWLPDWLKNGNFTAEQLDDLIKDHILTVGSRYKGQIDHWTVVNEAFTRGQHTYGLHDWWADHTGSKDYIDKAFIWARQADPHAKLILNDFNDEGINPVSNEMYDYIKSAKARGVPIDGIGMQMHIDGVHPPTQDEVVANMQRFADLGIDVYITEFDVNMNDVPANAKDKNEIQAAIYYEMVRACLQVKACKSFSILGVTDKETWYKYLGLKDPRPLPFDEKYKPKPAFFSIKRALEHS